MNDVQDLTKLILHFLNCLWPAKFKQPTTKGKIESTNLFGDAITLENPQLHHSERQISFEVS